MRLLWVSWLLLHAPLGQGSFEWVAPELCPPEAEVRARVSWSSRQVRAVVVQRDEGFEVAVSIDGQRRVLTAPSCEAAVDATLFLVELAGGQASSTQVAPLTSPKPDEAPESLSPRTPPSNGSRVGFHLSLLGGAELLLLPAPVFRFGVSFQVEWTWLTLLLDVRTGGLLRFGNGLLFDPAIAIAPLLDAQLGACRLFPLGQLRLGPCAQAGLGLVRANGLNVPTSSAQTVTVWTAGPGLRAAVPLSELLELQGFASVRFGPRPHYVVDGLAESVETNALGIDTGLGLGLRW